MKFKGGYKRQKSDSPGIGRWLKRYVIRRTCRYRGSRNRSLSFIPDRCGDG